MAAPSFDQFLREQKPTPRRPSFGEFLSRSAPTPQAPATQQPLGFGGRVRQVAETVLGEGARRRDVLAEALTSRKPLSPDVLTDVLSSSIPITAGLGLAGRAIMRGLRGAGIVSRVAPAVESVAGQLPLFALPKVAEPLGARAGRVASEVLNAPRAIMASFDMSAPLRQGIFLAPTHPRRFAQSFGQMFRYFGSEGALQGLQRDIAQRSTYPLMQRARLALTGLQELGSTVGAEEAFIGARLAERIPGAGRVIKASDRAYTGFLTKLRADVFDDLLKNAQKAGHQVDDTLLQGIGSFVNTATGRGPLKGFLGNLEPIGDVAARVFFSPRLMASRIALLNPRYYINLPAPVRKEALRSLAGFTGMLGTALGLAKAAGAQVGMNPTSADFGKIKVGNTRWDIAGGFQQYLVLGARLAKNETTSTSSGKATKLGPGFGSRTRLDMVKRFAVQKLAPVPSFVAGYLEGETPTGEEFRAPKEIVERFRPMMEDDLRELIQQEGWLATPKQIPAFFGVGVQTYQPRPRKKPTRRQRAE